MKTETYCASGCGCTAEGAMHEGKCEWLARDEEGCNCSEGENAETKCPVHDL